MTLTPIEGGGTFKMKSYWKLATGEVFKTNKFKSFMRLSQGSVGLDNDVNRGLILYFDATEEVFQLWSQQIELRGLAVFNEFDELVGEGEID